MKDGKSESRTALGIMLPDVEKRHPAAEQKRGPVLSTGIELWGGLDRDLGGLQKLLDVAVEQLSQSFSSMNAAMDADPAREHLREAFRGDVNCVIASLQFHDIASQMISNMRARAQLLELAALSGASGPASEDCTRLLTEVLQLSRRRPQVDCALSGDVDLF